MSCQNCFHLKGQELCSKAREFILWSNLVDVPVPMTTIATQEQPLEELEYGVLVDLLQDLHNGLVRKPDHFNNLHFLLFLLYDAHGSPRDRYPLWRWYHRIKKKLITAKHLTIDNDSTRQHILAAIEHLIDVIPNISALLEERVQLEEHYLHSPIYGLFKSYSPLHTYLYLEQLDKPIINAHSKVFHLFQSTLLRLYTSRSCDLIHFAIAHKKSNLLNELFRDSDHWLDASMNLVTERGWLPLHYAAYVADKDTVISRKSISSLGSIVDLLLGESDLWCIDFSHHTDSFRYALPTDAHFQAGRFRAKSERLHSQSLRGGARSSLEQTA